MTTTTQDRLDAALKAYTAATNTITLASLLLLAEAIREDQPDAVSFIAEWSDQGDYLSSIVTTESGPDGADEYDDMDLYASNLDGLTRSLWEQFATDAETPARGYSFRFTIDRVLAEVPPVLDQYAAPYDDAATLDQAVARMADTLGDGMTASDAGSHFTCGEAEDIADVLRAAGHDAAADEWLAGHGTGDDEGDSHYQGDTDDEFDKAFECGRCGEDVDANGQDRSGSQRCDDSATPSRHLHPEHDAEHLPG
jgi:hypothetical protein